MKMKALVCANCGSSLQVNKDTEGVIVCPYCGRETTLPKYTIAPEVAITLQLAETELSSCGFQKAYDLYAKAAEQDAHEPEAYFGMALSECKVQYIKDTVADRLQPVCHELGNKKFSDDANYKKALSLASPKQRAVYKRRAEEIDYIRSQFFKLSGSGTKYDCFICVKVTDEDKGHTEDCFIAQKLYRALKEEGYRPFYSEEEIGNRRGMDYEAMILYALCTSACMLVVCLDKNYLLTKWVKNEYTRFLSLSKEKGKKEGNLAFVYKTEPVDTLPGIQGKFRSISFDNAYAFDEVEEYVSAYCGKRGKKYRRKRAKIAAACALGALALAGAGTGIALAVADQNAQNSLPYRYEISASGTGVILTEWKGEEIDVVLPETIENLPIVEIAENAFKDKTAMKSVALPDTLTKIGSNAFSGCTGLTEFILPDTLTELGSSVLSGCTSVTSLTVETELVQTLSELFAQTPAWLTKLEFNGEKVDDEFAKNCTSLATLTFGGEVTEIGDYAFYGCGLVQSIRVNSALLSVGDYAFYNCGGLVTVSLPDTVTEIGDYAFAKAAKLVNCGVPSSLLSVGAAAFSDCSSLEEFLLPNGVTEVEESAFKNCKTLEKFTLPASVENVGAGILSGAKELTSISVSLDHVPSIGYLFGSQSNVSSVFPTNLKTATLLGESVPQNAFSGCAKFTKIILSESVKTIGSGAFSGCTGLTQAIFDDKKGWSAGETSLDEAALSSASDCATFLTTTYVSVTWSKLS